MSTQWQVVRGGGSPQREERGIRGREERSTRGCGGGERLLRQRPLPPDRELVAALGDGSWLRLSELGAGSRNPVCEGEMGAEVPVAEAELDSNSRVEKPNCEGEMR